MNNFSNLSKVKNKAFVIFDIDGCVMDDEYRLPLIKPEGEPDRWTAYHAAIPHDLPLPVGRAKLQDEIRSESGIIFITARPEYTRAATIESFAKNIPELGSYFLFMREDCDDHTPSPELKVGILEKIKTALNSRQRIKFAYDDRRDVCEAYTRQGILSFVLDKNGSYEYSPSLFTKSVPFVDSPAALVAHKSQGQEWKTDAEGSFEGAPKHPDIESLPQLFAEPKKPTETPPQQRTAADVLSEAAETFRARNAVYKDNANNVGKVMQALFPNGVQLKTQEDHKMYHLFELIIVKLTRFANSGLTHKDSVHDMAVYAAMCETLTDKHNIKFESLE